MQLFSVSCRRNLNSCEQEVQVMYGRWQSASARRFSLWSCILLAFHWCAVRTSFRWSLCVSICIRKLWPNYCYWNDCKSAELEHRRDRVSFFFLFHFFNRKPQIRPRREFHQREMTNWMRGKKRSDDHRNRNDCIVWRIRRSHWREI